MPEQNLASAVDLKMPHPLYARPKTKKAANAAHGAASQAWPLQYLQGETTMNATQEGEHEPTDCQRLLQYRTTGRQGGDRSSQSSNAAKELEKAALLQQANADRRNQENGEEYQ